MPILIAPYILLSIYSGFPGSTTAITGASVDAQERTEVSASNSLLPQTNSNTAAGAKVASASINVRGFYPHAQPSTYYATPGQVITWSGKDYAPNERVSVYGPNGVIATFRTADDGTWSGKAAYGVPFEHSESMQHFSVVSETSRKTVEMDIVVGTFYPNLTPSSYYVQRGSDMTATASGFAPGEWVLLRFGTEAIEQKIADQSGNATFSFKAPLGGVSVEITAEGLSSKTESSRILKLARQ